MIKKEFSMPANSTWWSFFKTMYFGRNYCNFNGRASLKEYLALSDVEELPSVEVKGKESLEIVLKDFEGFKALAESIRKEADEEDLYDVVSAMEGDLEQFNKSIWFIKAMLK